VILLTVLLWTAVRTVACHWETLHFGCSESDTIEIISANYGRRDTVTCPDQYANNVECIHSDTFDFLYDRFAVLVSLL